MYCLHKHYAEWNLAMIAAEGWTLNNLINMMIVWHLARSIASVSHHGLVIVYDHTSTAFDRLGISYGVLWTAEKDIDKSVGRSLLRSNECKQVFPSTLLCDIILLSMMVHCALRFPVMRSIAYTSWLKTKIDRWNRTHSAKQGLSSSEN